MCDEMRAALEARQRCPHQFIFLSAVLTGHSQDAVPVGRMEGAAAGVKLKGRL
jgi:hypothetical protein